MKEAHHKHIAIFASGAGSNAKAIIDYFKNHAFIRVALIVTNNKNAGVIQIAKDNRIPWDILSPAELKEEETVLDILDLYQIDLIVLAGFLLLIPSFLVKVYVGKIINIHPALLPKYGGKGMFGKHVHAAVLAARDTKSGITIHHVNEKYDEGAYILQSTCTVENGDNVESLSKKIQLLEHRDYPKVIEDILTK